MNRFIRLTKDGGIVELPMEVILRARDVNGAETHFAQTWAYPSDFDKPQGLTLSTGLTHHGPQGIRVEVQLRPLPDE